MNILFVFPIHVSMALLLPKNEPIQLQFKPRGCLGSQSFDLTFKLQQQVGPRIVNLLPLVCLIYFIFLKICQNVIATNSANTVKLGKLPHFASNPGKKIIKKKSLHFHVNALFEKSELIANWIINQQQFTPVLGSIGKIFLNFLMIFGL